MRPFLTAALVLLPALAAPAQSTPAQAENLVKRAVAYAKANGMDKLIKETNQGIFHVGSGSELYIFIYDMQGVVKAIGFNTQELVGKNRWDLKDPDGKYIVRELLEVAKKGGGWVDYKYPNPLSGKMEHKTSYAVLCDGLMVGSGTYKK
ncbi:MAG TPA: cache domain-containing protein [Holophaga sp.]|nr:cache domain-containing protein [Holophaga sp.]